MDDMADRIAIQYLAREVGKVERRWQNRRMLRWLIITASMAIGIGIGVLLVVPWDQLIRLQF